MWWSRSCAIDQPRPQLLIRTRPVTFTCEPRLRCRIALSAALRHCSHKIAVVAQTHVVRSAQTGRMTLTYRLGRPQSARLNVGVRRLGRAESAARPGPSEVTTTRPRRTLAMVPWLPAVLDMPADLDMRGASPTAAWRRANAKGRQAARHCRVTASQDALFVNESVRVSRQGCTCMRCGPHQ
jgi:hypothetical protein